MTQEVSSTLVESEPCMWGSATLVMLVSSIWVTVIRITEMVIDHFFADDSGGGGCAGAVALGRTTGRRTPARECPAWSRGAARGGGARRRRGGRGAWSRGCPREGGPP